jgi:hypothetical protein
VGLQQIEMLVDNAPAHRAPAALNVTLLSPASLIGWDARTK